MLFVKLFAYLEDTGIIFKSVMDVLLLLFIG